MDNNNKNPDKKKQKPGILRLDITKPRRSSGGSVEFRNQPELLGEVSTTSASSISPQLSVRWAFPQHDLDKQNDIDKWAYADSDSVQLRYQPNGQDINYDRGSLTDDRPNKRTLSIERKHQRQPGKYIESYFMEPLSPLEVPEDINSEDEDYSLSVCAVIQRRASTKRRKSFKGSRRTSSPMMTHVIGMSSLPTGSGGQAGVERRRSSVFTTSSGDTAISFGDGTNQESTKEQIFENIRLHKEVLQSVKLQPWSVRRKLRLVRQAKEYVARHEGALQERFAMSRSTKDLWARFKILLAAKYQHFRRELANISTVIIPWEIRIKEIESHFGSVVASYFTFLRWLFWVNIVIAVVLTIFVVVPEFVASQWPPKKMDHRKEMLAAEKANATRLITIWDFEGFLKYSPLFYGYYSDFSGAVRFHYELPLAYFLTGLVVYIYSFWATLRKMAENSRMSKLSSKDDECIFSWRLFTGWDFMIGHAETAHNRIASCILSFKEALLEEAEKKKDKRNWKIIVLRVIANIIVLCLLAVSAYAVVYVVDRSTQDGAADSYWRRNEITIVITAISFFFPMLFEVLGLLESYHPRKQLRMQLARIMALNLLNLYALIFALFDKISRMNKILHKLKISINHDLMAKAQNESHITQTTKSSIGRSSRSSVIDTQSTDMDYPKITTESMDYESFTADFSNLMADNLMMPNMSHYNYLNEQTNNRVRCQYVPIPCNDTDSKLNNMSSINLTLFTTMLVMNVTTTMYPELTSNRSEYGLNYRNDSSELSTDPLNGTVIMGTLGDLFGDIELWMGQLNRTRNGTVDDYDDYEYGGDKVNNSKKFNGNITDKSEFGRYVTHPYTIRTTSNKETDDYYDGDYDTVPSVDDTYYQLDGMSEEQFKRQINIENGDYITDVKNDTTTIESTYVPNRTIYGNETANNIYELQTNWTNETVERTDNLFKNITSLVDVMLNNTNGSIDDPIIDPFEEQTIDLNFIEDSTSSPDPNRTCYKRICFDIDEPTTIIDNFIDETTSLTTDPIETEIITTTSIPTVTEVVTIETTELTTETTTINITTSSSYETVPTFSTVHPCHQYFTIPPTIASTTLSSTTTYMSHIDNRTHAREEMAEFISHMDTVKQLELRKLCWETMFGQELVKLTVMDLVATVTSIMFMDFFRSLFVRFMNKCWCWDLEKKYPKYGDFKIAENILHLVNNQGQVWMGMFFSPGLAILNLLKLVIIMYLRSWAVLTCNIPHEVVFRASRSNNFYLALLLTMLFLCVLPVGYAIVWLEPSWHCGPFSEYPHIYNIFNRTLTRVLPTQFHRPLDLIASPSTVIPLLLLLILIIYYLVSLTGSLREANQDLKIQLRRERTEERRKIMKEVNTKPEEISNTNNVLDRWRKVLEASSPLTPTGPGFPTEQDEEKIAARKELLNRIMKTALRKGSNTSDEESHPVAHPTGDDETDTEQHDSLPHDQDQVRPRKSKTGKEDEGKQQRKPSFSRMSDIVQMATSLKREGSLEKSPSGDVKIVGVKHKKPHSDRKDRKSEKPPEKLPNLKLENIDYEIVNEQNKAVERKSKKRSTDRKHDSLDDDNYISDDDNTSYRDFDMKADKNEPEVKLRKKKINIEMDGKSDIRSKDQLEKSKTKFNSFLSLVREAVSAKKMENQRISDPLNNTIYENPLTDQKVIRRSSSDSASDIRRNSKNLRQQSSSSTSSGTTVHPKPKPNRQDSQASNWSDNIPVITISKTASDECILEGHTDRDTDSDTNVGKEIVPEPDESSDQGVVFSTDDLK